MGSNHGASLVVLIGDVDQTGTVRGETDERGSRLVEGGHLSSSFGESLAKGFWRDDLRIDVELPYRPDGVA